jgi:hypothetical protein
MFTNDAENQSKMVQYLTTDKRVKPQERWRCLRKLLSSSRDSYVPIWNYIKREWNSLGHSNNKKCADVVEETSARLDPRQALEAQKMIQHTHPNRNWTIPFHNESLILKALRRGLFRKLMQNKENL